MPARVHFRGQLQNELRARSDFRVRDLRGSIAPGPVSVQKRRPEQKKRNVNRWADMSAIGSQAVFTRPTSQLALDSFVDFADGELRSDPDCVLNGLCIRAAMTDNTHAPNSEQRRTAKFGIIHSLLKVYKS